MTKLQTRQSQSSFRQSSTFQPIKGAASDSDVVLWVAIAILLSIVLASGNIFAATPAFLLAPLPASLPASAATAVGADGEGAARLTPESRVSRGQAARLKNCQDPLDRKAREEVCLKTNYERAKRGYEPLKLDSRLSRVAQQHAQDMFARGYFAHESPDGGTMVSRLQGAQIEYGHAAENIAQGYSDAAAVVAGWMKSPGHRKNLLGSRFRKVGIGQVDQLWVQIFTD